MIHGIIPQFTECGKIKLGGLGESRKSNAGKTWRAPVKYDSFVITKTYRNAAGDLVQDNALMKLIERDTDGKLRAIPIVLHSDDVDDVFPTTYAYYSGKKLYCSGDGKTATRWVTAKDKKGHLIRTGERKTIDCPCLFHEPDEKDVRRCKPHGILHCSIRVPGLAVAGAIHTLRTTSIITIQRIIGSLVQIRKAVGMIQGLPLWLVVQPVLTDKGTVYCAHIELRAVDVIEAQRTALDAAKMRASLIGEVADLNRSYRAMLRAPAAADEPEDEQEAVADEFHPDAEDNFVVGPTRPPEGKASFSRPQEAASVEPEVDDDYIPHDPVTGEVIDDGMPMWDERNKRDPGDDG